MSNVSTWATELEDRTIRFSVNIIKTIGEYHKEPTIRPIIDQVIRSSTSIGANYAEANNASSRSDFKNKIFIAKKEASETKYWLRLLSELLPPNTVSDLQQEALELTLILQKIISTLKNGSKS
ncbi:MAG TPA: four helix bundle protein [Candidatus Saccharibacteria bacterium]|mgnify:CR=1 FL=1|nr:four helix bundle protein [Candidatus Saccharibacteria bacterium]HRQ98090.1 four helix bundle protein [Candidatus Saccharibacteria bacterium]